MSRPIAYNKPGAAINGSITNEDALISYVVDGRGNDYYNNYESCTWVPSADGAAPIVFVTDTFTRGYEGDPNLAVPLFFACAGTSSAAILYTANRLPGSPGNYTNANTALDELNRVYGYFILESNDPFQGINATDLVFDVDASKMTSYPQTGTNVYDLSGNGGSGALNNGVSWNATSGSFFFDGTDDDIYVNNYSAINMVGTQPYTAMATVYPLLGGTTWHGIFSKGNSQQYALTINSPSAYLHYESNQSAYGALNSSAGAVDVNRWQHFVARFDGNEKTIWKNGEIIATQATPGLSNSDNTEELRIGEGNTGEQFKGEITSVQVYRRSLSTAEIKQNYFGSPIVTDGLVFAVDANNIVSYPKSGTTTYSLTGSLTGTLTNGVGYLPNNGGTFDFDGTDDFIAISSNVNYTDVTIEAWIYREKGDLLNIVGGTGIAEYFCIYQEKLAYYASQNTGTWTYGTTTIQAQTWYHVSITMNNSNGETKMYVNGILESTTTAQTGYRSGYISTLGVYGNTSIRFWDGYIPNVRVYNRALSASEILQNYQAEQYRFAGPQGIVTNGLLLYLDAGNLDSYPGTGTTIYDLSGNGANGTLINGVGFNQTNGGVLTFDGIDDGVDGINIPQNYVDLMIGMYSEGGNGTGLEMVFAKYDDFDKSFRTAGGIFRHSGLDANDWNYQNTQYDYINGSLISGDVNLVNSWNIVRLVNQNATFSPPFVYSLSSDFYNRRYKGKIAFVLCYNRILTTAEVNQNYNFFKGRFGL